RHTRSKRDWSSDVCSSDLIADIAPDVVIANQEENRKLDVERLTGRGIQVWVTHITTVDEAFYSMRRLFTEVISSAVPGWLTEAQDAWSAPSSHSPLRVAVPIWRDPWMVIGASTFSGDLLSRLGLHNIFADAEHNPDGARYPHTDLELIDTGQVDAVLLPDEPYEFSAADGPEAFTTAPTTLVEGRLITWYGPSLLEARALRDDVDAKLNARHYCSVTRGRTHPEHPRSPHPRFERPPRDDASVGRVPHRRCRYDCPW